MRLRLRLKILMQLRIRRLRLLLKIFFSVYFIICIFSPLGLWSHIILMNLRLQILSQVSDAAPALASPAPATFPGKKSLWLRLIQLQLQLQYYSRQRSHVTPGLTGPAPATVPGKEAMRLRPLQLQHRLLLQVKKRRGSGFESSRQATVRSSCYYSR
jgi:hypothetical protein